MLKHTPPPPRKQIKLGGGREKPVRPLALVARNELPTVSVVEEGGDLPDKNSCILREGIRCILRYAGIEPRLVYRIRGM